MFFNKRIDRVQRFNIIHQLEANGKNYVYTHIDTCCYVVHTQRSVGQTGREKIKKQNKKTKIKNQNFNLKFKANLKQCQCHI